MHIKQVSERERRGGYVPKVKWKGRVEIQKLENKLRPGVSTPFNVNLWPFRKRYINSELLEERRWKKATANTCRNPLLLYYFTSDSTCTQDIMRLDYVKRVIEKIVDDHERDGNFLKFQKKTRQILSNN